MICPECRYEYFSKKEIHLFKCPVCKSNFIKSIIEYSIDSNSLNLLRDAIRYLGNDSLKDKQLLLKLIPKLYHSDLVLNKLLVISVNEDISVGMYNLINVEDRKEKLDSLKQKLITQAFLSEDAAKKIIDSWCYVLDYDENENTIRRVNWGRYYVNSKNEIIFENKDTNFQLNFSEGFAYTGGGINGQYYINLKGQIVTDLNELVVPQFFENEGYLYNSEFHYGDFHNGLATIKYSDEKYGYFNKKGRIIINCIYDEALPFSEHLAAVCIEGLWGFINIKGETVIKHKYDVAFSFTEGLAIVNENDNWTVIDKNGKIVHSLKNYSEVKPYKNGLARVKTQKYGYINLKGLEVISLKYDETGSVYNDLIPVKLNKWGVINKNDEIILPFDYDSISFLNKNLILVHKVVYNYNQKGYICGLYTINGEELLEVKYQSIVELDIDTLSVTKSTIIIETNEYGDKYDFEHKIIALYKISEKRFIETKYGEINQYSNGLARVKFRDRYGYIDKNGIEVIPLKFNYAREFFGGFAYVSNQTQWEFSEPYLLTVEDDDYPTRFTDEKSYKLLSLINQKGEVVIENKFIEASDFIDGLSKVKTYFYKDGNYKVSRCGYINSKGKWIYAKQRLYKQ